MEMDIIHLWDRYILNQIVVQELIQPSNIKK